MENNVIHYQYCPSCGSDHIHLALSAKDHTVSGEDFEVWACTQCSFRFTQDVPDAHHIGAYYKSDAYVSHSNTKKGLINRLYHLVRSRTLAQKRKLVKKYSGCVRGHLLDVGAGTGAFAATMLQDGWKVLGLEPDEDARNNAKKDFGIGLQDLGNLFSLKGGTYDAITLWHVLEHVHLLHDYLDAFQKLLKIDGALFIAVPNYTSYDAQFYGKDWAAWDVPRHLWHFSPKSMESLLLQHGFVVETYLPMKFDSFYVSMLSEPFKYNGKGNLLQAFKIGLQSNQKAGSDPKNYSSVIYVIKRK